MKRKPPDDTPERNETDSEEVARRIAESERNRRRDRGGTIELAAWLCALEDAECYKPIPESLVEHGRKYIHAGMTEKHWGDCTDQSHSCVVCGTDGYLLHARQILEALTLTNQQPPVGWGGHLPGKIDP